MNEGRFGYRVNGTNVIAPWDIPENEESINAYLPAQVNGFRILTDTHGGLGLCNPITGARPPGNCLGGGPNGQQHHGDREGRDAQLDLRRHAELVEGHTRLQVRRRNSLQQQHVHGQQPGTRFLQQFQSRPLSSLAVQPRAPRC